MPDRRSVHNTNNVEELMQKLDGEFISGVTDGTPNTESVHTHTLGRTPRGFIVISADKAGSVYDSTNPHTDTEVKVRGSVASIAFQIYVF